MFLKSLVVLGTIFSLVGLNSGDEVSTLYVHNYETNQKDYNVASVSDIKYESYDAKGNKTSGTLKFETKYLDTSESIFS